MARMRWRFRDARALVRADPGDQLRRFALAQVVAGTEQHQRAPVTQRHRGESACRDHTVDACGADFEDMALVVVRVEIVAEMAVPQREPRVRQKYRIFSTLEQRAIGVGFDQRSPLGAAACEQCIQRRSVVTEQCARGRDVRHAAVPSHRQEMHAGIRESRADRSAPFAAPSIGIDAKIREEHHTAWPDVVSGGRRSGTVVPPLALAALRSRLRRSRKKRLRSSRAAPVRSGCRRRRRNDRARARR